MLIITQFWISQEDPEIFHEGGTFEWFCGHRFVYYKYMFFCSYIVFQIMINRLFKLTFIPKAFS